MGFAEGELQIVFQTLMEKILSEKLSAKCPFNFIIMEKGGYVCDFVECENLVGLESIILRK